MARRNLPNGKYSPVRARQAVQDSSPPVDLSVVEAEIDAIDTRVTTLESSPPDYTTTNFNTDFATKTTTDLTEGSNLYFTNTRVDARVTKSFVEALNINVPWANVTSKPSTFTPSTHTHPISDITSLQASLDAKANLTGATFSGNVFATDGAAVSGLAANGDVYASRSGGTTGYMFFNSAFTRYFGFDGTNYVMNAAGLNAGGPYTNTTKGITVAPSGYAAGVIGYSDVNWGYTNRPPVAGAIAAHRWDKFDGTEIMRLTEAGELSVYGSGGRVELGTATGNKLANSSDTAHSWIPYSDGNVYLSGGTIYFRSGSYVEHARVDSTALYTKKIEIQSNLTAGGVNEAGLVVSNTPTNSAQIRFITTRDWSINANGSFGGSNFVIRDNTVGADRLRISDGGIVTVPNTVNTGLGTGAGGQARLEVLGNGSSGGAFMTFHRPGAYATYMGLDSNNTIAIGGWSRGSVSHPVAHVNSGNGPNSGKISWGTGAPGTLAEGEIYLRYS